MKIRNERNGSYNGIKPYQIIDIDEKHAQRYLSKGFVVYEPVEQDETPEQETTYEPVEQDDLEKRKEFLSGKGVAVSGRRKDQTVIDKSDALGYEA